MTKRDSITSLVVFACAIALFAGFVYSRSGPAKTPPAFIGSTDLTAALAKSKDSGKPVLAFATADWCGPCQELKRSALVDPAVQAFITDNTLPVYIDVDANESDAESLNITGIPVLIVLRPTTDGRVEVSRLTGVSPAADVLDWLTSARDEALKAAPAPVSPEPATSGG